MRQLIHVKQNHAQAYPETNDGSRNVQGLAAVGGTRWEQDCDTCQPRPSFRPIINALIVIEFTAILELTDSSVSGYNNHIRYK